MLTDLESMEGFQFSDEKSSRQSPMDNMSAAPTIHSQITNVNMRKARFIDSDPFRILWIGYSSGRCVALWNRVNGPEPFVESARVTLPKDPTDICHLSAERHAISLIDGAISIFNTSGDALVEVQKIDRAHGSGDSRTLCATGEIFFSGSSNGTISVVDATTSSVKTFKSGFAGVRSLCTLSGGSLLVSGHSTGQLLVWDLRDRDLSHKPVVSTPCKRILDAVSALTVHPAQSNLIAFGSDDGTLGFCDIRGPDSEILPRPFDIATSSITQICFHPEYHDHMLCSSADGSLVHWDATSIKHSTFSSTANRISPWLSEQLPEAIELNSLRNKSFSAVNGFDVTGHSVIAASEIMTLVAYENVSFPMGSF